MKKKIKCQICGRRFYVASTRVYRAKEPKGAFEALVKAAMLYDVVDCPSCGCQCTLAKRMDKVAESEAEDD